jgi:DNA-binding beta-propeller fold protein YncE
MSKLCFGAALFAGLIASALSTSARANVIYDLTLTAISVSDGTLSTYDGTGTIALSSAPSLTMETDYTSAAVTFSVDGESFSGTATHVQFLDGNFRNATFSEAIGNSPLRFALDTTGGYIFYYDNELEDASGTITAILAPTATPIAASLPLFASGLAAVGLLARRRKRKVEAAA